MNLSELRCSWRKLMAPLKSYVVRLYRLFVVVPMVHLWVFFLQFMCQWWGKGVRSLNDPFRKEIKKNHFLQRQGSEISFLFDSGLFFRIPATKRITIFFGRRTLLLLSMKRVLCLLRGATQSVALLSCEGKGLVGPSSEHTGGPGDSYSFEAWGD